MDNNFLSRISILTGVAIIKAIQKQCAVKPLLKWPNDIFLGNKKLGGILIETQMRSERSNVVIGVGLNINENESDIPSSLKNQATSINIFTHDVADRVCILKSIVSYFFEVSKINSHNLIHDWESSCIHMNKKIRFKQEKNRTVEGVFVGIDSNFHAVLDVGNKHLTYESGIVCL